MSAYLLIDLEVTDPEGYEEYKLKVPEFIHRHGGEYRARGGLAEAVEGDWQPNRFVILEFPTVAHIEAFLDDPGYALIKGIRHRCARSRMIVVDGLEQTNRRRT